MPSYKGSSSRVKRHLQLREERIRDASQQRMRFGVGQTWVSIQTPINLTSGKLTSVKLSFL